VKRTVYKIERDYIAEELRPLWQAWYNATAKRHSLDI
jgi:hypothetical protein